MQPGEVRGVVSATSACRLDLLAMRNSRKLVRHHLVSVANVLANVLANAILVPAFRA